MSRSLRFAALLVLVVIFGVITQQQLVQRDRVLDDARDGLARFALVFAEQTGRAIESADLILRDIADQQHLQPDQRPAHRMSLSDRLQHHIAGLRQVIQIAIADPEGRVLAAAGMAPASLTPANLTPANLTPASLTREGIELIGRLRADPGQGAVVSAPFRLTDGEWTVLLARPFLDPQGRFGGIVAASLNLRYFEEFYRSIDLGEDGEIVLYRRDGVVLSSYPPRGDLVGTSFADLPPFRDVLATSAAGTLLLDRPSDGRRRVVAVRALRNFPFAVGLSLSADNVLASWRGQSATAIITGLMIAGIIGVLLLLIAGEGRRVEVLLHENTKARAAAEAATIRIMHQMEERERTEAALRQAQRLEAVGQLTGGVAHDFNNLLTVLLGNIELMQATLPIDARGGDARAADSVARTRLERMRVAAERGATLTDQLLAFARRQPLVPRAADLNIVITGMLDLLKSAIGSNIEVDLALAESPWPVLVDTTQIELVILNLSLNARDAMPTGGRLRLETENVTLAPGADPNDLPAGDYVAVRVSDGGAGMSAEVVARAFEPFFTTKGPSQGSGLGLSQVYGVARQSGGSALIDSRPGAGTTVSVLLPRASAEPDADFRRGLGAISVGARILLVDDDEAVRTTTALILESAGYVLVQADGARAALAIIEAGMKLDLLLTDVAMPVTNGAQLADQVRALRPDLPIVFISGYADPSAIAGREKLQPLVRKPFRVLDLMAEIEASLAEVRA